MGGFGQVEAKVPRLGHKFPIAYQSSISMSCLVSHYASYLDYLGNLKANLLLDIDLHNHVETLYEEIRNNAPVQYTHPFVSIDLGKTANAFKTSDAGLEI
ncbi:hypothetical protein RHMOL_Rhmol04G0127100 [Rhododendron molle]|uniref:Uncharacterized protein n=1 Tax=Rhododendron molle TaxID=49168 RepID=A0ACC0NZL6_RHOML|nr:hypothetical protein RHMOL_Rhmol04G0127100 [Rhododendron molle]